MNKAASILSVLLLSIITINKAAAQKAIFTANGGLTIGFGLGANYQQSDIANSIGGGFDFTLGSHIYKKENAFLAVDWKFRFLAGENKAFDHRMNIDTTFNNIKYDLFSYDLELGLTLNRLRERTRIVITGFAGAGITHGRTFTDMYDENGALYDYTVINPNQDRSQVNADLIELSDGDFETRLVNKAAILPTAGIYIGYQFSRSFSMGIEHKTSFLLTEHNSITGINIDNNIITSSRKDRNHYTTIGFKWNLGRGSSGRNIRTTYNVINTLPPPPVPANQVPPVINPPTVVPVPLPVVDIIVPMNNPYSTSLERTEVMARVQNVKSRQNIQVVLNGKNIPFEYSPLTGNVNLTVSLSPGNNNLVITGTNEAGRASDNASITLKRPAPVAAPAVRFINPAAPVTVDNNVYGIRVQTTNVRAWQDVSVMVNGASISNFNFSPDGVVSTNIGLKEGMNSVEVQGRNESGVATGRATITYTRPAKAAPPVINILTPGVSPYNTSDANQQVSAIISGIRGKENITVSVNSVNTGSFTFDPSSLTLNMSAPLSNGRNMIIITARNEAGQDVKQVAVIREIKPCPSPALSVIAPAGNDITTDSQSYTFITEVSNITMRSQLSLTLNGRSIQAFSLSGNRVTCTVSLDPGSNNFMLAAKNDCGAQTISSSIIYKPAVVIVEPVPCPKPLVNINITAVNRQDATHELRGTVSNVKDRNEIRVTINGNPFDNFRFVAGSGELSATLKLNPGTYTIAVNVATQCGTDSKSSVITVAEPCLPPQVTMNIAAVSRPDATHELKGLVSNAGSRNDIRVTINGTPFQGFQFVPGSGELSAFLKLNPGNNTIAVNVATQCGTDSKSSVVTVAEPCLPPQVTMNIAAVSRPDATHELRGTIRNVSDRNDIKLTIDGNSSDAFRFVPGTGEITASFRFNPGNHTVVVSVKNECGQDTGTRTVTVEEEKTCGIRLNPGNAPWQFCLVTNSGTFTRENLASNSFSYSGPATSLFFMPIAGGGEAVVNGKPYSIKPGQYYLFTGRLTVTVSTKNPGSMGQWSVCIIADREPVSGNGNNRPKSPCEETQEELKPKKDGM